jgi:hypothetical protein
MNGAKVKTESFLDTIPDVNCTSESHIKAAMNMSENGKVAKRLQKYPQVHKHASTCPTAALVAITGIEACGSGQAQGKEPGSRRAGSTAYKFRGT